MSLFVEYLCQEMMFVLHVAIAQPLAAQLPEFCHQVDRITWWSKMPKKSPRWKKLGFDQIQPAPPSI